ncbi:TetR family transcriptional regulator [Leptolyngbya sp. AN02str]|uniref:TetR family transcriptional regulator n=1 Tax=Leptolyngbya sp. AN02str TaxID=3423363 RepID=UPI003D318604
MSNRRTSTRQRLIQAATQLFIAQGVAETTTRQIADLAEVNEVTLFRHFRNKHGLLLAMMEDADALALLGAALGQQVTQMTSVSQVLKNYATVHLQALEQLQEFVRSLIGESGHYPIENRRALGRGVRLANRYTAQYLAAVLSNEHLQTRLPNDKLAGLLNSLLLGYAVLEFTSEFHELWHDREYFVDALVELFLYGALVQPGMIEGEFATHQAAQQAVIDLPSPMVHDILRQAKQQGVQDFALAYVLFATGLSVEEIARLGRSHVFTDDQQSVLQVVSGQVRQVPVNSWILGRRYGSHSTNPLMQWLKTRNDNQFALFLTDSETGMTPFEIRQRWQRWVDGLITPQGMPPAVEQARASWCVEMLMRGMSPENLSILLGREVQQLEPYIHRAQEKMALEEAARLDRRATL